MKPSVLRATSPLVFGAGLLTCALGVVALALGVVPLALGVRSAPRGLASAPSVVPSTPEAVASAPGWVPFSPGMAVPFAQGAPASGPGSSAREPVSTLAPLGPGVDAAAPPFVQRVPPNPGYGAGFVFTRIRYQSAYSGWRRRGGGMWAHDYPRADWHLSTLLEELTFIDAETDGTNVLELDDPELFKYPIAYISEPGDWGMTDEQAERLREYVLKGGFLIFDDFEGRQFDNMAEQLRRALPEYTPIRIDVDHPIFQSFFAMEDIYFPHPLVNVTPIYWGLFEDNDPTKRMLAIINHNNDIAEYWEWSADGWFPVDITNDAYKLGINYIVFAMTR